MEQAALSNPSVSPSVSLTRSSVKRRAPRRPRRGRRPNNQIALWGLGVSLVTAPLLFGGVFEWTVVVIASLTAVATGLTWWTSAGSDRGLHGHRSIAWWLIAAAGWTAVQAAPLPCRFVGLLSPRSEMLQRAAMQALGAQTRLCSLSMDGGSTVREVLKWATLAAMFAAAAALARQGQRRRLRETVAVAVLVTAAVTVLHGVLGLEQVYATYSPVYASPRVVGPLMNDNNLGGFLLLGAFLLSGIALDARERSHRYLWGTAAVVVAITLLMTLSRAAVAAAGFGLAVWSLLMVRRRVRRRGWRPTLALGAGGSVALAWAIYLGAGEVVRHFREQGFDKLELIARSFALAVDHPITGVGRGAFSAAFAQRHGTDVRFEHAENVLADWTAEWGMLFGLGLAWAIASALFRSRKNRRSYSSIGAAAALAALCAHSMLDFTLELLGVALAAVVVLATLLRSEGEPRATERYLIPRWLAPLPVASVGLLLALVCIGWMVPAQSVEAQRAALERSLASSDGETFRHTLRVAVRSHPAEPTFALLAATDAIRRGDEGTGRWLNHAMRLAPEWSAPHLLAARWLRALNRPAQAALELREAGQHDPIRASNTFCELFPESDAPLVDAATPRNEDGETFLSRLGDCGALSDRLRRHVDNVLIERGASTPGPWVRQARSALGAGDVDQAQTWAEGARNRAPNDQRTHLVLAEVLLEAGNGEAAVAALRAGREHVANPRALLRAEAEALTDRRDDEGAAAAVDALRALAGGRARAVADVEVFEARLALRRGNLAGAIASYEDAYRLDPRPELLQQVAELSERLGDPRRAAAAWQRLRSLAPENPRYEQALEKLSNRDPSSL